MHNGRCQKLHHCQRVSAFYFYTLSFYPLFNSGEMEVELSNFPFLSEQYLAS